MSVRPQQGSAGDRAGTEFPGDLLILALTGSFLVLLPPRLDHLSRTLGPEGSFSPDAFGGAATGIGLLLWASYLALTFRPFRGAARVKLGLVVAFATLYLVLPVISDMSARADLGLQAGGRYVATPHDGGVLQTEAAIGFLLEGKNPYAADYGKTEMAASHHSRPGLWRNLGFDRNPALGFYPYPPLTMILSLPFYAVGGLLGAYDQRVVYLAALAVLGLLAWGLPRRETLRLPLLALLVLSPLHARFFVQGYNDVLVGVFLVATLFAAHRGRHGTAALLLGVACGLKQFAWILVPLYLAYRYGAMPAGRVGERLRSLARETWPLAATVALTFLPFLLWGPGRLYYSLITAQGSLFPFRSGSLGLSNLLLAVGWIDAPRDPYPALLLYLLLVLPLLVFAARDLARRPALADLLFWYALVLVVFLFVSRFFAFNYLWLPFTLVACAVWARLDPAPAEAR